MKIHEQREHIAMSRTEGTPTRIGSFQIEFDEEAPQSSDAEDDRLDATGTA